MVVERTDNDVIDCVMQMRACKNVHDTLLPLQRTCQAGHVICREEKYTKA